MKKTINDIQDEIIDDFSKIHDWMDKYDYLIKLGKSLVPLEEKDKSDENALSGCQSQVWLKTEMNGNRINFFADSDSLLIKGMISLLLRVVNNQPSEDIINAELYFIEQIGLNSHLSPSRENGLMSMVKHIKSSATMASGPCKK